MYGHMTDILVATEMTLIPPPYIWQLLQDTLEVVAYLLQQPGIHYVQVCTLW